MKGDLHTHSYYSDGIYSPREVMRKAKISGCEIVALTDHDTLDGIPEADAEAKESGIINIRGVEISAFDGVEVHVLGYDINTERERFVRFIEKQKKSRRERAEVLLAKLAEHGLEIPREIFDFKVKREISRSHIAGALVGLGYEKDFMTAMNKWLRKDAPTFVPMQSVTPEEAIEEIHAAGGLAVLAHPVRLDMDSYSRTVLIKRLARVGLDGIEAVYKRSSQSAVKEFRALAKTCGLFVTAGADFHGDGNEIIARDLDLNKLTERFQTR